ncbi:DUF916 and DUF3324 domain-containing protein [Listeria booriae]|uniref:DUF916 and DUF3324 domain-containing protein n=1 Tax=Listeria booriae TaxID=1552123 RepID=A0A7X1A5T3_9LIST|nr:DUF916 and DUF3324 domain-containing protein [Listeria booriae]
MERSWVFVKKLMLLFVLPIVLIGVLFHPLSPQAAANFSVTAVIPDNQIDKTKTYFDLRMKPGQKQDLEVVLKNDTDKEITIETNANTAVTNDNGIVDYSQTDPKLDKSLKTPFSSIAKTDDEVVLPKNSSKTIKVTVTMPAESFDGIILGGLQFIEKEGDDAKKDGGEGVQIKNRYAYVVGVQLSENDTVVEPDMKLHEIKAQQINYRNAVTANLQNPEATLIKPLAIDAKVYKSGDDQVLHQAKRDGLRMAPNSNFNYAIDWENQPLKVGKYRLKMVATSGDKTWKWDEEFTIKGDDAKKYNETAVDLEKDYTWWYIAGGALAVILLVFLAFWLGKRSKKDKDEDKK